MKGDFSSLRIGNGPNGDQARQGMLWLQQGRPLLDSDFNQAMAGLRDALLDAVTMVVGQAAGPADTLGFAVTPVCSLVLNEAGAAGRHCLWQGQRPSPPEAELAVDAAMADAGDEEVLTVSLSVVDVPPPPPRPLPTETIQLVLTAPDGAEGPIIVRQGAYAIRLLKDRSVVLELPGAANRIGVGELPHGAWGSLLIALDQYRLHVKLGDGALITATPGHPKAGDGEALIVAAADPQDSRRAAAPLLRCRLSTLREWSAFLDLDRLAASLARGEAPPLRHMAFDLDLTRITADGEQSGHMADRQQRRRHMTLWWSGSAPRLALERYTLSPGRYYVGGLPCDVRQAMDSDAQPFLPDARAASAGAQGHHLISLDLQDRAVDALEDPGLADPALQGVDTMIRQEITWQVRARPVPQDIPAERAAAAVERMVDARGGLAVWRTVSSAPRQGNGLLRVEIHHPGWANGPTPTAAQRAAMLRVTIADPVERLVTLPPGAPDLSFGAPVLLFPDRNGVPASDQGLSTRVVSRDASGLGLGALPATLDGVAWLLPIASFKWSYANAASSQRVESVQAATDDRGRPVAAALLASSGFNGLDVGSGDWVELGGRDDDLMGRPGRFLRVVASREDELQVLLDGWTDPLPYVPPPGDVCRLRLWSQRRSWQVPAGADKAPADLPWPQPVTAAAQELDAGVWVRFTAEGEYRCGDFWTAPLRQGSLDLAGWPAVDGQPATRPPQGMARRTAPLALIRVEPWHIEATDLRRSFPSLSDLAAFQPPPESLSLLSDLLAWARRWHITAPTAFVSPAKLVDGIAREWMKASFGEDLMLLVRSGKSVGGFETTGETVATRCVETASWTRLGQMRRREGWKSHGTSGETRLPRGPGHGASVGPLSVFIGAEAGVWIGSGGHWRHVEPLGHAAGSAIAVHRGCILLAGGGGSGRGGRIAEIVRIDPIGEGREEIGTLEIPVSHAAAVVMDDTLFVIGGLGNDGEPVAAIQALDLKQQHAWSLGVGRRRPRARLCGELPSPRAEHGAVAWNGVVIVAGGSERGGRCLGDVLVLNPETWAAMPRAELPHPCRKMAMITLPDGIVMAGGLGEGGRMLADVMLYRPQSDRWSSLASLPHAGHSFALVAQPGSASPDPARLIALGGAGTHGDHEEVHALSLSRTMDVVVPRST